MATISVSQALIIALWVAAVMSRSLLGGATLTMRFSPLMTGLVVGLVFGRVSEAMMITAAIQLIYMGVFSPGGQMPSEPAVAAAIAVPVSLLGGMSPEESIGIAVPVGLLGSYLYQFRFFVNTFIQQKFTERYAAEANDKGLTRSIIIYPTIAAVLIFVPFMFISLYYGAPVIADFIASNSSTLVFHVLSVIGGGLAAIGIAVSIFVIGKDNYMVFFLLGYFLTVILKDLEVTMVVYAIIGVIVAYIFVLSQKQTVEDITTMGFSNTANEDDDDY